MQNHFVAQRLASEQITSESEKISELRDLNQFLSTFFSSKEPLVA